MSVTKEQFEAFVKVQKSGQTNMWDYNNVDILSHGVVTKDAHIEIIKNYRSLAEKYLEVV